MNLSRFENVSRETIKGAIKMKLKEQYATVAALQKEINYLRDTLFLYLEIGYKGNDAREVYRRYCDTVQAYAVMKGEMYNVG